MRDGLKGKEYYDGLENFYIGEIADILDGISSEKIPEEKHVLAGMNQIQESEKLFFVRFSAGEVVSSLVDSYEQLFSAWSFFHEKRMKKSPCDRMQWVELTVDSYERLFNVLSLAVLLCRGRAELATIHSWYDCADSEAYCRRGSVNYFVGNNQGKDALLDYLFLAVGLSGKQGDTLKVGKIYKDLYAICLASVEQRPAMMKKYIETWYAKSKFKGWHDLHKYEDHGYVGYWSLESALIVRLLGIDDKEFADHPHYPKDLARFPM